MDPLLLDALLFASGLLLGYVTGTIWTVPVEVTKIKTILQANGPDGIYVRLTYADGQVTVRKINKIDLDPEITYRGRTFAAGEWTPDGHVYNEVL